MALRLRVMSPSSKIFDQDVDFVALDALDGSFGVLPGHAPLAAVLKKSPVRYEKNGSASEIKIDGGFAKVMPDSVSIFAGRNA